jgi:PQQ-like domain
MWSVQLDGEITTPCTIADGVVYVAAGASVYALH